MTETNANGSKTAKLHQIIAIETNIRTQSAKDLTAAHHGLQKTDLLFGLNKTYQPNDEEGEKLPEEIKILQTRTPEVIRNTTKILEELFDTTATRDFANCHAKSDVVLEGGNVLIKDAPATYLLWLAKRLEDLYTFVEKLPVLPGDVEWDFDDKQNCYKSPVLETARKIKIPYPLVLAQATTEHPAQVVEKSRDEIVGYHKTIRYNGSLPAKDIAQMKDRVKQVQKAVKFAREQANTVDAPKKEVGRNVLSFVFGKHLSV